MIKVASLIGSVIPNLKLKTGDDKPRKALKNGELEESWRSAVCSDEEVVKNYELDPLCTPYGTYKG
jgi:hypothetical protein